MSSSNAISLPNDAYVFLRAQSASENEDYASIADAGALFVSAGDPAGEDDPIRKGTAFQVCLIPLASKSHPSRSYVSFCSDVVARI
jgi:hypothetical protein